jgi:hypothetical protein
LGIVVGGKGRSQVSPRACARPLICVHWYRAFHPSPFVPIRVELETDKSISFESNGWRGESLVPVEATVGSKEEILVPDSDTNQG